MPIFDKKLIKQLLVVFGVVILIFGIRFFSGSEDTWLCVDGEWVKHGVPYAEKPIEGCGDSKTNLEGQEENQILKNISHEVKECLLHSGKPEYRKSGDGREYTVCVFLEGKECELDSYLKLECPVLGVSVVGYKTEAARYCVSFGGEYRAIWNKYYKTSKEEGECVFGGDRVCSAFDFWMGRCDKETAIPKDQTEPVVFEIEKILAEYTFEGKILSDDKLIDLYGDTPDVIFKKRPSFETLIKRYIPSFNKIYMGQGYKTVVAELDGGRKILIFSGCSFDGCLGTMHIGAYDLQKRKLYLLTENEIASKVNIFGAPDDSVKRVMVQVYLTITR